MAKLIDKDTLVSEIERRIKHYNFSAKEFGDEGYKDNVLMEQCKASACERILSFINTLEVKEVDLDEFTEKINTFQARYKHPEITSIKGAMAFMARMFYQYPNVAREWYESLPKATMD